MIKPAITTALLLFGISLATSGPADAQSFAVTSADALNGTLPRTSFTDQMGCDGHNVSPEISWRGAPEGTKSFVVSIYDQDAQTGSGFWHWVVINVPAGTTSLPRGAGTDAAKLPAGAIESNTDIGEPGYVGPCPPVGQTHRYLVTVKALSVEKLQLPNNAPGALVGLFSNMNSIGQATVTLKGSR